MSDAVNPSPANYEAFVGLMIQAEPAVRRFVRTLLPAWGDVDEVVQRVALAAWRKFDQFEAGTEFLKWALVIARFEVLAYRRAMARDRLVFSEQILELLADESVAETELGSREERALESCLKKLDAKRRELVLRAYAHDTDQRDIAAALGKTPAALYMLLSRIRRELLECIERTLRLEALS